MDSAPRGQQWMAKVHEEPLQASMPPISLFQEQGYSQTSWSQNLFSDCDAYLSIGIDANKQLQATIGKQGRENKTIGPWEKAPNRDRTKQDKTTK